MSHLKVVKGGCSRDDVYRAGFEVAIPQDCPLTPTLSPQGRGSECVALT